MKIPVMLINGTLGVIRGEDLDEMLDKKLIVAFQRASGLAIVGRDELRSNRGAGSGSWKNRKNNQRPREEVVFLPRRAKLQLLYTQGMTANGIDAALAEEPAAAVNQR